MPAKKKNRKKKVINVERIIKREQLGKKRSLMWQWILIVIIIMIIVLILSLTK